MSRVFVGNLPMDVKEREVEDLFYKYGRIRNIEIKTPSRPPAFAFVTYDDRRDAEDAVYYRDGYKFDGERLRVELAKGGRDDDRGRGREERRGATRRTAFRVEVSGLPDRASWQDLKDFMRPAGDVVYTDVDRRGGGVVEFSNKDDMLSAIKRFDNSEFKMSYGTSTVTVRAAEGAEAASSSSAPASSSSSSKRSRSRSGSRGRSDSRDRRSRSRSNSRGRSASRDSRSRSRSRSR